MVPARVAAARSRLRVIPAQIAQPALSCGERAVPGLSTLTCRLGLRLLRVPVTYRTVSAAMRYLASVCVLDTRWSP